MKVEKKSRKSVGELPAATQDLIRRILGNSVEEVVREVRKVTVWRYGKCELYHWIDVLDMFDYILATVTLGYDTHKGFFMCEKLTDPVVKGQVLSVLNFTALLIEHSYARHIYNSTEHLCVLLASPDLDIVLAVLNLLYVFGKRSNFISRLPAQQRSNLNSYLEFLGETWGGAKNGFGLARCCQDLSLDGFPPTATSVYFEYQPLDDEGVMDEQSGYKAKPIVINNVDKLPETIPELMTKLTQGHPIPPVQMMRLMTRLRLARDFGSRDHRIKCVLVRLQAISVLVYSMAPAEVVDPLIYDGLVEELVEVLEMKDPAIQEVRAAVLRTLTAIIHLERDPRLGVIIEVTGASTYHGFLPTLVRDCVAAITSAGPDGTSPNHPLSFATALFSFLYHLATYEASGDALVNSGVMESLLQVLEWKAVQPMNITLVTRAVRVVDLITNLDMTAFHSLGGWDKMLERLKMEVEECKEDAPTILPSVVKPTSSGSGHVPMETDVLPTTSVAGGMPLEGNEKDGSEIVQCMPERSALIKSILNFLKKAIPDPTFAENIRNFVNSSLPSSLAHIASNAEYYGASIYLPATEVATTFIFHDPSQLSPLQDNGLPWIILNSLINKKIPVTREVLSALPNILSALCLNSRGLQAFIEAEPFDHLFGVLISPDYLPAMRRKRGNETLGDTASNLGGAMDELMRHQPLLRESVMSALIRLLRKLCAMGNNPVHNEDDPSLVTNQGIHLKGSAPTEEAMTSEDDEEDDRESHISDEKEEEEGGVIPMKEGKKKRSTSLPLTEYTQNVVHFVDCILSTSSSDDHIKDFVSAGGLPPLISLLSLPALPLNFPSSTACNSVISACKAVLHCAHESKVLEEGLSQLSQVLTSLQQFIDSPVEAKGSILLNDLASCPTPDQSYLLHNLTAAGSYIQLFIQLAKCIPVESKQICVKNWASPLGQKVLDQLSSLYRALVWEGFIVLAKASEKESKKKETEVEKSSEDTPSSTPKAIPISVISHCKTLEEEESKSFVQTLRSFTPPLAVTSRVGRSLAELMSLLVRICSGPLHRPVRRGPGSTNPPYHPPSEDAISVCNKLTKLLVDSLTWDVPTPAEIDDINDPDMKEWLFSGMTFKMYAVDFCLLLLFDEHRQSFHLMLHCFNENGVMDALIKSFHAAIDSIKEVREGSNIFADYAVTSDFLEAWLNLTERLIDTSCILDSTHGLPIPPPAQTGGKKLTYNPMFNPVEFVVNAQKALFPCVCKLWPPENISWVTPEVAEHLMSAVKHFFSCEKVIHMKLAELNKTDKPNATINSASSLTPASSSTAQPPRVDPQHLQQLMDMGFVRDHAEEALLQTRGNLAAAMDWMLVHPPSTLSQSPTLTEDELLAKAIAMSLEQNTQSKREAKQDKGEEIDGSGVSSSGNSSEALSPIDEETLTRFSEELLNRMLEVIPRIRDTVYHACDLMVALIKRNGPVWRDKALTAVKEKVLLTISELSDKINDGSYTIRGGVLDPNAFYICLLALLMEELPLSCGPIMCKSDLLEAYVRLLALTQQKLPTMKREQGSRTNPMWVAPLLLTLELWLGIKGLAKWSRPLAKGRQAVWMWFENTNGRWCCYSPDISRTIEASYREGETSVRIVSGRQRYTIQFNSMIQINLDSGTQRPVTRLEVPKKKEGKQEGKDLKDSTEEPVNFEVPSWFCKFSQEQASSVVTYCTRLLSTEVEPDTLHANMRLLLALTQDPNLAKVFMAERGPHALLALTRRSSFHGFSSLSSLLLRHVLEDDSLLEQCMDTIIRGVVVGGANDSKEFKAHGPGRRDFDFVLRKLAPCACRDEALFTRISSETLRLANEPPPLSDYLTAARVQPVMLKYVPLPKKENVELSSLQNNLLTLLIDHLCTDAFIEDGLACQDPTPVGKIDEDTSDSTVLGLRYRLQGSQVRRGSYRRQVTDNDDDDDVRSEDMVLDVDPISETRPPCRRNVSATEEPTLEETLRRLTETDEDRARNAEKARLLLPLFSQAAILRLLAEIIESYPVCAKTIIKSSREIMIKNRLNTKVSKEVSILAFILDYLLPASYTQGSSATQVAKLAKVFLHSLASTTLPNDALTLFVSEFRAAFSRALALPESLVKHYRIRALAGLLGQIVEPQTQTGFSSRSTVNPSQFVRMLIRKGFITDLSKAVHSLDMSSALLTTTINSILKPLECLTKIVTQFLAAQKKDQAAASSTANPPPPPPPLPNPVPVQAPQTRGHGNGQGELSSTTVSRDNAVETDRSRETGSQTNDPQSNTAADQSGNDTTLDAGDMSLIPLVDEDQMGASRETENEHEDIHELMVQEAISIAHDLGLRTRDALNHRDEDSNNDNMDIQEIVDELLDRSPGGSGIGPHALMGEDEQPDVTVSGSELSDGSEEEDLDADNYNSAGEEIDEEDFDESQNEGFPRQVDHENDQDILEDTSDSQTSTEVVEEDHPSDNEEEGEYPSEDEDGEEEGGDDSMVLEESMEEGAEEERGDTRGTTGGVGEGGEAERDETFEIEANEEEEDDEDDDEDDDDDDDEEEEEEGLELDYHDLDMMEHDDYIHIDMPSLGFGWRDFDSMEAHYLGGFPSLLSRAYHIRSGNSMETTLPTAVSTLPQHHPLLMRYVDHPRHLSAPDPTSLSAGRGSTPADIQRSNIVQQLLTNISTSVGTEEILSFNVGGSNPRQSSSVRAPDPNDNSFMIGRSEDSTESTTIPSNLARWREECDALNGPTAFLCIAGIRSSLLELLTKQFTKQQTLKKTTDKMGKESSSTGEEKPQPLPFSAPNPSDETTPSTATPGNTSTSVEQLRSSLRAVADALSQMGGSSRPLESSETSSQDESTQETREGVRMEDSSTPVVSTSESRQPDHSRAVPSRLVDTMPDLSMLDGSQDSARAILRRIGPDDPLYTFLSAVARAPTPPLPETTSDSTSLSPSRVSLPSIPPVSTHPHQLAPPSNSSLQVSVIQNPRPFDQPHSSSLSQPQSQSFPPVSISSHEVSNLVNRVTSYIMNPSSQSSQPHSQSLEPVRSNFADLLATELDQAISNHLATLSTPSVTSSSTPSIAPPPSTFTTATSSPSPSDTLAPLLSSLQMPNQQPHPQQNDGIQQGECHSSHTVSETGQTHTATGQVASITADQTAVSQNEVFVPPLSTTVSSGSESTVATTSQTSQPISQTNLASGNGSQSSEFPEGIDPTFLAALPDSIRQEVLTQYERDQRQQQQQRRQTSQEASSSAATTTGEINPEVLAALPPDIQEEVLQQQRLEEARRMSTDPAHQGDATSFLSSLTPDLRRTILSDMDDTQIAQLPEDIAAEARSLRQERENRSRQLLELHQARYEQQLMDAPQWSHAITHSHPIGLSAGTRYQGYAVLGLTPDRSLHDRIGLFPPMSHSFLMQRNGGGDLTGKQILDQEGLACLLALLFLDQSKIHFNRLFRIFRSLSQHIPSRSWLISSLLSILRKTNSHTCPYPGERPTMASQSHWLNMTINAALGSHVSVFQFVPHSGKAPLPDVYIHPHATVPICSNVLELMIFLARQFPSSFLPPDLIPKDKQQQTSVNQQQPEVLSNFWQLLFKLDSSPRKGKGSSKMFQHLDLPSSKSESDLFSTSPIGSLMKLFDHPVIQSSVNLVDKLLRVLSVISGAITKQGLGKTATTNKGKDKDPPKEEMSTDQEPSGATAVESKGLEISESPLDPAQPPCYSSSVVSVSLLHSVINLLTSGKCTEDCLDDATNLLINLSRCSSATREAILLVLLEGVQKIGHVLSSQISVLLTELADKMPTLSYSTQTSQEELSKSSQSSASSSNQADAHPSLGTTEGVVLPTLQGRGVITDHSQDLHLPCMEPLICKGSQQSFFLRLLKVVCQLRESSQPVVLQGSRRSDSSSSFLLSQSPLLSSGGLSSIPHQQQQEADPPTSQEGGEDPPTGSKPAANTSMTQDDSARESSYSSSLSLQLELEELWISLSDCLDALANTYDPHAVLVLQPTVEAFFLVHADQSEEARSTVRDKRTSRGRRLPSFHTISDTESNVGSPSAYDTFSPAPFTPSATEGEASDPYSHLPPDTARFLKFAERHRTVLNQILRQSTIPLSEGPFAVLVNHTRLLDFDVKRRYFRQELEQLDEGLRRDDLVIHVRRDHVFEDSYRELYRRSTEDLKANLYVTFEGEEGQDAGGLLREWYLIIAREMFNPNYALFKTTPGDRVTYMPNPSSHINPEHLSYFKFVGRIIAKAIYDNKLLDCYFTRSFYKHILGKPVHYTDMESEDYSFYQGMVYLLEHDLNEIGMELTFSTDIEEFGKTESRDLKPKGRELPVTEVNKREYVQLACQMKMTGSIRSQIKSFLEGFYEVIPKNLISIFNEQELELLISGLPNFDIDDLKANTEYHKYTESSLQIQWFWRALRSYSQADRARFLQFVTGTSKVPLQGFVALEGMNGIQKFQIHRDDRSTERLPSAHTCFNHLDLPPYETYDKLNHMLLTAVRECPEGFGFA